MCNGLHAFRIHCCIGVVDEQVSRALTDGVVLQVAKVRPGGIEHSCAIGKPGRDLLLQKRGKLVLGDVANGGAI